MLDKILKKSSKNFLFSIVLLLVSTLGGFIATPMIISYVGKSEFGVYRLILEYLGYIGICDLGLTTSSCSLLSEAWCKEDRRLVIRVVKMMGREYLKIIPLLIVVILLTGYALLEVSLQEYNREVIASFLIMAFTGFLLPLNVFRDFLLASEKSYIISKLTTYQLILMTALNILLSYLGYGLVGLALSFLGALVLYYVTIVTLSFREIVKIPMKNLDHEITVEGIWNIGLHSFVQSILGRLSLVSDTIILSFFYPAAAVTNFVTNQRLAKLIDSFLKNIGNSTWASMAKLKDNKPEMQKALDFINKFFIVLSLPFMFSIGFNNQSFMKLWLGDGFYISDYFTWTVIGNYTLFGIFSFWGWVFVCMGKVQSQTMPITVSGILNIIFSFLFTHLFGEIGPVLGTFTSFCTFYLWGLKYKMKKDMGLEVNRYILGLGLSIIALAVASPLVKYVTFFKGDTWLELIGNLASLYFFSLFICLLVNVRQGDWQEIKGLFKKS